MDEPRNAVPNWGIHGSVKSLANVQCLGYYNAAGRHYALLQDVADPLRIWAGSATGGLWVTENRADTWSPVHDQFFPMNVRAIAQDPSRPDTIYYSTYGVLHDSLGLGRSDILRSTDHGQTFHYLPQTGTDALQYVTAVATDPTTPGRLYAISNSYTQQGKRLLRSDDGGNTFQVMMQRISGQNFGDLLVRNDGSVFITRDDTVFRSPSGDPNTFATSVVQGGQGILRIAYCRDVPDRMYALVAYPPPSAIHRSDDGGVTWYVTDTLVQSNTGRALAVRPDDPDVVLTGQTGMFISHNGGYAFEQWQGLGVDHWMMAFDSADPSKAFVVNDGGFGDAHTEPFDPYAFNVQFDMDSSLVTQQIYWGDYFPNSNAVICGQQDLGTSTLLSPSGSISVLGGDGAWCFTHKQDTTIAYASSQYGHIFRDDDVNSPWVNTLTPIMNQLDADNDDNIDEGALFINPFLVLEQNSDVLFFPTKKRLWRSVDRGENWTPISQQYATVYNLSIAASHHADPWIYWTEGDSIFIHTSGLTGTAGQELTFPAPTYNLVFVLADPVQDSTFYVASNSSVWRCHLNADLSLGHMPLTNNFNVGAGIRCFAVDPDSPDHMYIGHDAGLYFTEDGGATWARDSNLPPVQISCLRLRAQDRKLFIFTYGRGAWLAELPTVDTQVNAIGKERPVIAPNPFGQSCTVMLPSMLRNGSWAVYDLHGRMIRSGPVPNSDRIALDGWGSEAEGTYILCVKDGKGRTRSTERLVHIEGDR